uniref:Uncharacterized protein n=1 Tax=Romanomermis culicivorax TaxID=13658 RepID=A0A915IPS1_ROMCU
MQEEGAELPGPVPRNVSFVHIIVILCCDRTFSTREVTRKGAGVIADSNYFVLSFVRCVQVTFESRRGLRIYVACLDQETVETAYNRTGEPVIRGDT